jgi:hypothetical protein
MDLAAVFLTLSAVFGWLNHKFLPLSHSVGLLVMSLFTSLILIGLNAVFPGLRLLDQLSEVMQRIDFAEIVVNGMLAFLLFRRLATRRSRHVAQPGRSGVPARGFRHDHLDGGRRSAVLESSPPGRLSRAVRLSWCSAH